MASQYRAGGEFRCAAAHMMHFDMIAATLSSPVLPGDCLPRRKRNMITLYHCVSARSFRPLWALEELGLPYTPNGAAPAGDGTPSRRAPCCATTWKSIRSAQYRRFSTAIFG